MRWGLRYPQKLGDATVIIDMLNEFDAHDDFLAVPHGDGNAVMICQPTSISFNTAKSLGS